KREPVRGRLCPCSESSAQTREARRRSLQTSARIMTQCSRRLNSDFANLETDREHRTGAQGSDGVFLSERVGLPLKLHICRQNEKPTARSAGRTSYGSTCTFGNCPRPAGSPRGLGASRTDPVMPWDPTLCAIADYRTGPALCAIA